MENSVNPAEVVTYINQSDKTTSSTLLSSGRKKKKTKNCVGGAREKGGSGGGSGLVKSSASLNPSIHFKDFPHRIFLWSFSWVVRSEHIMIMHAIQYKIVAGGKVKGVVIDS